MFPNLQFSQVRICYANLTIQFETLPCFAASFYDTFFAQDNIRGIAGAYISSASATEHEISIDPEYEEKLMAHKIWKWDKNTAKQLSNNSVISSGCFGVFI